MAESSREPSDAKPETSSVQRNTSSAERPASGSASEVVPLDRRLMKRAVQTLTDAFVEDPFYVFLLPRVRARRLWLRTYMKSLLKMTLPDGNVYAVAGSDVPGVVVPLAPGRYPPPRARFVLFVLRMLLIALIGVPTPRRLWTLLKALEAVDRVHLAAPHWYIEELAVSAEHRGRGLGRVLLDAVLSRADDGDYPVYLETTNEVNIGMYRHFGFEIVETLQCPGGGPPIWTMLRKPLKQRVESPE